MALTRKPSSPGKTSIDVEALINKGGSVATDAKSSARPKAREVPVILRVPAPILTRIDALVSSRQIRTPRHTWLLEALVEKLNREEAMAEDR